MGVSPRDVIDPSDYSRGKGVFAKKAQRSNEDQPLRLLDIEGMEVDAMTNSIAGLDLDVLIDLSGFTQNGEPFVLSRRPAVLQANYLGFPGSENVPWIDFNIQDSAASPPQFSPYYTEKLVYLPFYYASDHVHRVPDLHPYQRPGSTAYLRRLFKVPETGFMFCFPNQLYKLTSDLLDVWANILRRVPTAYLWLLRHPPEGEPFIRDELMARGIFRDRVLFSDFEENKALYMVRTSVCDVVLDSPLWSAGATGLDSYWSGVPIVSLPGDRTVERLGDSLMVSEGCRGSWQRATYFSQDDVRHRHDVGLSMDPPLIVVSMKVRRRGAC